MDGIVPEDGEDLPADNAPDHELADWWKRRHGRRATWLDLLGLRAILAKRRARRRALAARRQRAAQPARRARRRSELAEFWASPEWLGFVSMLSAGVAAVARRTSGGPVREDMPSPPLEAPAAVEAEPAPPYGGDAGAWAAWLAAPAVRRRVALQGVQTYGALWPIVSGANDRAASRRAAAPRAQADAVLRYIEDKVAPSGRTPFPVGAPDPAWEVGKECLAAINALTPERVRWWRDRLLDAGHGSPARLHRALAELRSAGASAAEGWPWLARPEPGPLRGLLRPECDDDDALSPPSPSSDTELPGPQ